MKKRLLVRMDDFGGCDSANRAILECLAAGVGQSVGVMAPGLALEGGCKALRATDPTCVGVHGVINAEWSTVKWGPVLGPQAVPSLVDERGMLTATPMVLYERGFLVDEVLAEIAAQVRKVRDQGLDPVYLDEHMGFAWLPGVRDELAVLARREGLVYLPPLEGLPDADPTVTDPVERLLSQVDRATSGDFIAVYHPGMDRPDMQDYVHEGLAPGVVAKEREGDRRLLTDPRLAQGLRDRHVELISYRVFR